MTIDDDDDAVDVVDKRREGIIIKLRYYTLLCFYLRLILLSPEDGGAITHSNRDGDGSFDDNDDGGA